MSDRSLDEFVPGSESDDDESEPEMTGSESDEGELPAAGTVDPTEVTATVAVDGAACESCGEAVTRRWDEDGASVCRECKEW